MIDFQFSNCGRWAKEKISQRGEEPMRPTEDKKISNDLFIMIGDYAFLRTSSIFSSVYLRGVSQCSEALKQM